MKKTVSLLALLAALCCLFTVSAAAADAPTSGTCGENLTWTLDGAGTLTIAGEGAMENYRYNGAPWYQNRDQVKNAIVENGVTTIGSCAFYGCKNMASVTLLESVTTIGSYAFSGCSSLTGITIPESVTSIGSSAFSGCSSLTDVSITDMDAWCRIDFGDSYATPMRCAQNIRLNGSKIASVTVPEGVTELNYTFDGFKDLIRVMLPKSLTGIGEGTFDNCTSLTSVTFAGDSQLTTIGSSAFCNCTSLISVTIPDGVTSIGNDAFSGCSSLTGITLPESVTSIGSGAFSWCSSLTGITLPEGVTSIGDEAFYQCSSLTGITIPEGVTSIEDEAFYQCSSLTGITIPEGVTSIGNDAFYRCSSLTGITVPESVTSIGSDAFSGCSSLPSITVPKSVTSIGSGAFSYCDALADVSITDLEAWFQIDFENAEASPFYSARNLYLNGQLVESLEIPASVSVIPTGLFRNATCLKRVAIPRSLAGVAANAFANCTNITEVFYEGSESEWTNLPISAGNDPLKNAQVYFGSTLENYYCRITVAVSDGGRVTVDHTTAKVGETVTVTAAPYPGYELAAICVDGADIQGNTFTVTGNHVVSARFTRVPVVGGNEDFRLEGISVRTAAGDALQELPAESLLVTVAVKHLKGTGSGTILLAQYDSLGRYRGLMWLTLDEMPQGMTLRVILPVDNSGGEIANLKVFVVEDLTSSLPVGTPVSFGQV